MLEVALRFLQDQLNEYLETQSEKSGSVKAKMTKLVDDTGRYAFEEEGTVGTIGIFIFNIEEERIFKSQIPEHTYTNGQHIVLEPELKLNLHVLFAAKFTSYEEALKHISCVLMFFQSHPAFTSEYPGLDSRIAKLTLELQSLSYEQLNQIWTFIGGKQLPSVVYKVRMVALQDQTPTGIQSPVREVNTNINSQ